MFFLVAHLIEQHLTPFELEDIGYGRVYLTRPSPHASAAEMDDFLLLDIL
jgi:hypothetical protein